MLESAGSDLDHIVHVKVFLKDMADFEAMNGTYVERFGGHRPARTVIGVRELPKRGVLLTMNLTAVTRSLIRTRRSGPRIAVAHRMAVLGATLAPK
jgi:2-iminobutanoate/2-iminopropanoate deaminase